MKKVLEYIWRFLGVLYFPIYLLAWILHGIARFLLALSYLGMLQKRYAKDIIKSLFTWRGKY